VQEETEADGEALGVCKGPRMSGMTMCDACGDDCDLAAPDTHATIIDDCMPLTLCGPCCRRVVWGYMERGQ
jgi:hypothetical protein